MDNYCSTAAVGGAICVNETMLSYFVLFKLICFAATYKSYLNETEQNVACRGET